MKYVALLRGINVGGNNIIKMVALKACFEKEGFKSVSTFIQSGNVIFESEEKHTDIVIRKIESSLSKTFSYKSRIVLRSLEQMKKVVANVPDDWQKQTDIRCYIAFIKEPMTAEKVGKDIELKDGVDSLKVGNGVLYMTTLFSALTKSRFNKLAGKKIYQDMTIRNYNTTKKITALME